MLITRRVPVVSASAYVALTPAVVRCAVAGLTTDPSGRVVRRTRIFAKASRPEVAEQFLSPAPPELLRTLVERGDVTEREADLAALVPVADDITVEADSGSHTDNRPPGVLLPVVLALRAELTDRHGYRTPPRVGAAGGLGTPQAVASAFAMGAAYVVTGSVNHVSVEAGLSDEGKSLLGAADVADVTMAPASDKFELGVKLQVLCRGTMFAAAPSSSTTCTARTTPWRRSPRRYGPGWSGTSCAARSTTCGPTPTSTGRTVTPGSSTARSRTPGTVWRCSSVPTWAGRAAGP